MTTPTVDALVELAQQLSEDEQGELIRRLEALNPPQPRHGQRPSATLRVFHVDHFPDEVTLRREDEYGDDER